MGFESKLQKKKEKMLSPPGVGRRCRKTDQSEELQQEELQTLFSSSAQSCRASASLRRPSCLHPSVLGSSLLLRQHHLQHCDSPALWSFCPPTKMLACTEMITMCLQSAKQKHLLAQQLQHQHQQQPPHTAGHGLAILHDIFRRADKNDDGKLSFEEFNAYFADGILTTEELQELFYSIDGRQNNNLDTDKLSDYFSQHLGEYLNVLSSLESLNIAILKAMDKTKEEYQGASVLGQFVTRFMLRETSSQLLSLQRSLQCAMEAVEEQSSPAPREAKAPALTAVQRDGRQCGRRVNNNLCMSSLELSSNTLNTSVTTENGENWSSQINRLQLLLDKLEFQGPKLEPLQEDTLSSTCKSENQNILLVQRQMSVIDDDLDNFQKVLKSYTDATSAQADNLHVSVQKLPGKLCYIMYEFWRDRVSWMSYLQSNSSKDFQRCIIDMLEDAEIISTMLLPDGDSAVWAA
uniref:N-terminal EF-hand calcium binding protein 3 n=1 Tax=Oryzias melastigma TaxID=30732 RepID=A0A3B3CCF7_ORYME